MGRAYKIVCNEDQTKLFEYAAKALSLTVPQFARFAMRSYIVRNKPKMPMVVESDSIAMEALSGQDCTGSGD